MIRQALSRAYPALTNMLQRAIFDSPLAWHYNDRHFTGAVSERAMYKAVRNATILGLGLSASALIGWLFLRESKRKQDAQTITIKSQIGGGQAEDMPPIVLPREALDASASELDEASESEAESLPGGADDFTLIRGVGPRFAQALRDGGITSFAALARETPESLAERMAPHASVRAQRIRDFDWIGQARAHAKT